MNAHDSRRIEEVLSGHGYQAAHEGQDPDLVLFNTCSIREKAEHKVMSAVGRFRELKVRRPELVIVLAGCVAQQEGERLLQRSDLIDLVVGPDNIPELPQLIDTVREGGPRMARTVFDLDAPHFLRMTPRADRSDVSAYVTVMKGCDERCTFCVVPYTRGSERYRAANDIVAEVSSLVAGGVQEITLLGQTVNSWHEPDEQIVQGEDSRFAELLERIAREVPQLGRLRYTSPHPRHMTPSLVKAHRELDMLAHHVHLPVQSGSNRVLRRMRRRYTREEYLERAALLRAARSDMTLSTDLIVGFPGETDEDFEQTLDLFRQAQFSTAFVFKYSPRPRTPALKLDGEVPLPIVDQRFVELMALVDAQQLVHLQTLVGTQQQVLIEGASRSGEGLVTGRTRRNEIVHLPGDLAWRGVLIDVRIESANRHSLTAVRIGEGAALAVQPASNSESPQQRRHLPLLEAS